MGVSTSCGLGTWSIYNTLLECTGQTGAQATVISFLLRRVSGRGGNSGEAKSTRHFRKNGWRIDYSFPPGWTSLMSSKSRWPHEWKFWLGEYLLVVRPRYVDSRLWSTMLPVSNGDWMRPFPPNKHFFRFFLFPLCRRLQSFYFYFSFAGIFSRDCRF